MVLGLFLFGGMGVTAYAANSALPGDTLYSLKTKAEGIQARLTTDPAAEARLYMDFANRRLLEIQSLIEQGRYTDIAWATDEFEADIQRALGAARELSQTDSARAAELTAEIASMLRRYSNILSQMLVEIPGDVQPAIQHAIDTSQSAAGRDDDGHGGNGAGTGGRDGGSANPAPPAAGIPVDPAPTQANIPGDDDDNGSEDDNNDNDDDNDDDVDDVDDDDEDDNEDDVD
jgi:hypothetical protein